MNLDHTGSIHNTRQNADEELAERGQLHKTVDMREPETRERRTIADFKAEAYFVGQIVCGMKFDCSE